VSKQASRFRWSSRADVARGMPAREAAFLILFYFNAFLPLLLCCQAQLGRGTSLSFVTFTRNDAASRNVAFSLVSRCFSHNWLFFLQKMAIISYICNT
jgi:hypothetical protein